MENPSTSKGGLVTITNNLCGEARQKNLNFGHWRDNQKGGKGMVSYKGFFGIMQEGARYNSMIKSTRL